MAPFVLPHRCTEVRQHWNDIYPTLLMTLNLMTRSISLDSFAWEFLRPLSCLVDLPLRDLLHCISQQTVQALNQESLGRTDGLCSIITS